MKRVCAWCGKTLEDPAGEAAADAPVTHGICKACKAELLGEVGVPLQEFLDSLGAPVLLVSGDFEVEAAGRTPLPWLGGEMKRVEGLLGGEVFQCANASLPGGCGRTLNCTSCAIRGSVEHTFKTGGRLDGVPATLTAGPLAEETEIDLLVSTEKVGDRVVLRIEAV